MAGMVHKVHYQIILKSHEKELLDQYSFSFFTLLTIKQCANISKKMANTLHWSKHNIRCFIFSYDIQAIRGKSDLQRE